MTEITTYLSPNGQVFSHGDGPATCMLVATAAGVATLKRANAQAPWEYQGSTLTEKHIGSLLYEPTSGKLFAGAHADGGLWVSDDGQGRSWRQLTHGLTRAHIYTLAALKAQGKVILFAGTDPAGLYRSTDLGETWHEVTQILKVPDADKWTFPVPPHIAHMKSMTVHPTEADTLFVLVEQGALLKSVDAGNTFTEISSYARADDLAYRDMHRLAISPHTPSLMYLATGEGLYRSHDAGKSWKHLIKPDGQVGYPDHVFFDPNNDHTVFMAGTAKDPGYWFRTGRADPMMMKSTDQGENWKQLRGGIENALPVSLEAMCQHVWPSSDGRVSHLLAVGTAAGEVWTSEDHGNSWQRVSQLLAPIAKDHHHLPFLSKEDLPKWLARRPKSQHHEEEAAH